MAGIQRPELRGEPTLWRARIAVLKGENERAISLLRDALAEGSTALAFDDADPELGALRSHPAFNELTTSRD